MSLSPSLPPCPHLRSHHRSCGWLDPPVFPTVLHKSHIDSTAGPELELLESNALRAGLLHHPSIRTFNLPLNHLSTLCIRVQVAGGLMQGAYHIGRRRRVWSIWAGKSPPRSRGSCRATHRVTRPLAATRPQFRTAKKRPGLEPISGIPMPCHAHAMPMPCLPLLSSRLVWYFPGSHITIAHTLPHDIAPSPPNSAERLTERLANSCQPLRHGTRSKALARAFLLASRGAIAPPGPSPFLPLFDVLAGAGLSAPCQNR